MKYFKLVIVLAAIVASFFFLNKDISESTVHKMIKNDFAIEANFCGCFGCGAQIANVYTQNGKRWLKLRSNISQVNPEFAITEFTPEKEKQLDSLIIDAIKNQEKGGCTTTSEYKFENKGFSFRLIDNRCSVSDFFNLIASHHSSVRG